MNLTGTVEQGQQQIFKFYLLTPHRDANRGVRSVRCYLEAVNEKKNISYFLERVSDSLRLWDCHQEQHKDSQRILTDHISVVAFVTKLKVLVGESESRLDQMLIQLPAMISQDYQVLAQLRLHCQIWTCKSGSKAGPGGRCGRDNWTDLNKEYIRVQIIDIPWARMEAILEGNIDIKVWKKSSIETENSTLFFLDSFLDSLNKPSAICVQTYRRI